ncbi:hypothetical protein [Actinokineospora sp. UTMC 2448]|uniref:hypothetical protein n=1 Tax=Actinokineospora sp. UTMC 2448 TaxID=2268449 RepID=UPI002164620C|nr:hypothetical protein [Actinokineospora sp. UTMC 2448]UVS78436.1 hypothetical protein Actkin_02169 [Actinokineospora sp. UTMC 2448]
MSERLGHKHIASILALMVLGREVANPELRDIVGFPLVGEERRTLNDLQLVTSRKSGRAYAHELTDRGWAWCAEELDAPPPPQPRSLGVALYLVLGALGRYLRREKLALSDVFTHDVDLTPEEIEIRVRAAYRKLAAAPRDWVRLVDLRSELDGAPRTAVDDVLKELSRTRQAHLVPEANRKALGPVDHEAALRVGGEDNHMIAIEAS